MVRPLDETDRRLLGALQRHLRPALAQISQEINVARGTVYSRLDRLRDEGVVTGYRVDIAPTPAGLGVSAFATLEIAQGSHEETTNALADIIEIVEIHTVTGPGDLLCRIVARSNDHLHDVLLQMTALPTVVRSSSQLILSTSLRRPIVDVILDT